MIVIGVPALRKKSAARLANFRIIHARITMEARTMTPTKTLRLFGDMAGSLVFPARGRCKRGIGRNGRRSAANARRRLGVAERRHRPIFTRFSLIFRRDASCIFSSPHETDPDRKSTRLNSVTL